MERSLCDGINISLYCKEISPFRFASVEMTISKYFRESNYNKKNTMLNILKKFWSFNIDVILGRKPRIFKGDENDSGGKRFLHGTLELGYNILLIVLVVWIIRTNLISPFQVSGQSMFPSFYDKDFIIINRFGGKFLEPNRGEVVVFRPPTDESVFYIKRIVGIPGDQIKFESGDVFLKINGEGEWIELEEDYLNEENNGRTFVRGAKKVATVPESHYFVLGDNRNHSTDSRQWLFSGMPEDGTVREDLIVGPALVVLYRTEDWRKLLRLDFSELFNGKLMRGYDYGVEN